MVLLATYEKQHRELVLKMLRLCSKLSPMQSKAGTPFDRITGNNIGPLLLSHMGT
jgi:hypothetical protein